MRLDVVALARQFLYVREAGQNRGYRVEAIQHWATGNFGDSWCAEFATMILDIAYQGKGPFGRTGACETIHGIAQLNGWLTPVPAIGDLFLYLRPDGTAHHVGFVTGLNPLTGIAGNTSIDGTSVDGDGVHEHAISATTFIHLPI